MFDTGRTGSCGSTVNDIRAQLDSPYQVLAYPNTKGCAATVLEFDLIFCLLVRSSISKSLEGQIGMYMVHAVRMRELYRRRCEYGVAQVNR